ncbi:hypothetical protein GGS23DRAFT_564240 [Durotheca rogersii]|uniref:uncharacterized protein n=1 Tax=Durotheca rogersii TaxID=419775 RepID=UPI00221F5DAF|nr:uncharacterized protein GGS23DRAFT_564240 [Durotheca rogersii]KAI5864408.1 hypothetical protein GGS23DRAFT_564240 [Durotheca rogersii]
MALGFFRALLQLLWLPTTSAPSSANSRIKGLNEVFFRFLVPSVLFIRQRRCHASPLLSTETPSKVGLHDR